MEAWQEVSLVGITILRHCTRVHCTYTESFIILLGTGGVQGQVKGQQLMGIKAVNDSIGLATCQSKIYEK